ncbi:MAG: GTP-binding protein [archaeon]|nr:GTP-binding protein [archaeon]
MTSNPMKFNLILLGDQAVGKTSLLQRYVESTFKEVAGTAGLDIKEKTVNINGEEIKLNLYDSAGHNKFRNIAGMQVKKSDGLVIVYDVTDKNSFEGAKFWLNSCFNTPEGQSGKVYILLGNKIDLEDQIVISTEEGQAISEQFKTIFYETSAKNGVNVEKAFSEAVTTLYNNRKREMNQKAAQANTANAPRGKPSNQKDKSENACCLII